MRTRQKQKRQRRIQPTPIAAALAAMGGTHGPGGRPLLPEDTVDPRGRAGRFRYGRGRNGEKVLARGLWIADDNPTDARDATQKGETG